jgi:carbon monoxide dehydrogenase subunit G
MRVAGTLAIRQPAERIAAALHDPAVLQRMLPACEGVDTLAPGQFRARLAKKLGLIMLRAEPEIRLSPAADGQGLDLNVQAASRIVGSFATNLALTMRPEGDATVLAWDGEFVTTGLAQRLLAERHDQIGARVTALFTTLRAVVGG